MIYIHKFHAVTDWNCNVLLNLSFLANDSLRFLTSHKSESKWRTWSHLRRLPTQRQMLRGKHLGFFGRQQWKWSWCQQNRTSFGISILYNAFDVISCRYAMMKWTHSYIYLGGFYYHCIPNCWHNSSCFLASGLLIFDPFINTPFGT